MHLYCTVIAKKTTQAAQKCKTMYDIAQNIILLQTNGSDKTVQQKIHANPNRELRQNHPRHR